MDLAAIVIDQKPDVAPASSTERRRCDAAASVAVRASLSAASLKFTEKARKELQVTIAPRMNSAVGQDTASVLNRNPANTAPAGR